jgi:hypothetical protein
MPININVGLSKKVGLPKYSSLAASCSVQFEAEYGLLESKLDEFQLRVCEAFAACRQAVQEELARQQENLVGNAVAEGADAGASTRRCNGDGNGQNHLYDGNGQNGSNCHAASERQYAYLRQLASQIPGLGLRRLESLVEKLCGKPFASLTSLDASRLIDTLKAIKVGATELDDLIEGAEVQ